MTKATGEGTVRALPMSVAVLLLLGVSGCSNESATPATAKGETPVRYVICDLGGTGCFVPARFKDMDGCESHKKWSEMLCDSRSTPGEMHCQEDHNPLSVAYCTL